MASTSKAATDPGSTTSTLQEEVVTTTIVEDIVVVKCGLRSVIALDYKEYAILSATIEQHVELVSKMMRRASLVLLHHLLTLTASGTRIPDLYAANTTFWKNLLKLDVASGSVPSDAFLPSILATADAVGPVSTIYPVQFDQVVSYAATTFATVVKNNAWVLRPKAAAAKAATSHPETEADDEALCPFALGRQRDQTHWVRSALSHQEQEPDV